MIQREISRVLVLNLLWQDKPGGACAPPRTTMPLTEPSLLSRGTHVVMPARSKAWTTRPFCVLTQKGRHARLFKGAGAHTPPACHRDSRGYKLFEGGQNGPIIRQYAPLDVHPGVRAFPGDTALGAAWRRSRWWRRTWRRWASAVATPVLVEATAEASAAVTRWCPRIEWCPLWAHCFAQFYSPSASADAASRATHT